MKVVYKRSEYMPTLNSYFLSDFDEEVVSLIKTLRTKNLGGDKYISKRREWEVTDEVYFYLKKYTTEFIDKSVKKKPPYIIQIDKDDPKGLYSYQDTVAIELRKRMECLLFFDTGTGKTRTALLALSALSKEQGAVIVVGESNLSNEWLSQVKQHFPEFYDRFLILNDGSSIPKRVNKVKSAPIGTIFIINIQAMRNKMLVEALNSRMLAVCILDECQCIIGKTALQTLGMHSLQTDYRWALSATPIKNNPLEWHSLLAWLRLIRLDGSMTRFKEHYAYSKINKFGQVIYENFRNEQDLHDLINEVAIRVSKEGLGLPEKSDVDVVFELNNELSATIKEISRQRRKDDIKCSITINERKFDADNITDLFYIERVGVAMAKEKIDYVLSHMNEPLIVVSCLKAPLEYIYKLIPDDAVLYHGDISIPQRTEALQLFRSGKKKVFLMTQKSGGVGLTLVNANNMIFLDAPANEADYIQCTDRIHRIGQERKVTITRLKIRNTIDDFAWSRMKDKQSWIQQYFDINYGGTK